MPAKSRLQGGPLNDAVASILNALLESKEISRRELASMIETSHTYINNRLNGNVDFTITDVEIITATLKIDFLHMMAAAIWASEGKAPEGFTGAELSSVKSLAKLAGVYAEPYPEPDVLPENYLDLAALNPGYDPDEEALAIMEEP